MTSTRIPYDACKIARDMAKEYAWLLLPKKGQRIGEFGLYLNVTRAGLSLYLGGVAEGDPIIFESASLTPANSLKCYLQSL